MAAKPARLSKGILDMKFMKRTRDKVTQAQDDAEGRAMYAGEITDRMLRQDDSPFVCEPSFVPVEGLRDGRFSFGGMNPEIERLLELEEQSRRALLSPDVHKDVADEEMADRYHGNVAHTVAKAFARKAPRDAFRRKFALPEPNRDPNPHNKYQQRRGTAPIGAPAASVPPKRPRYLKPDDD